MEHHCCTLQSPAGLQHTQREAKRKTTLLLASEGFVISTIHALLIVCGLSPRRLQSIRLFILVHPDTLGVRFPTNDFGTLTFIRLLCLVSCSISCWIFSMIQSALNRLDQVTLPNAFKGKSCLVLKLKNKVWQLILMQLNVCNFLPPPCLPPSPHPSKKASGIG